MTPANKTRRKLGRSATDYKDATKQRYRDEAWRWFSRHILLPKSKARVAILDTSAGLETATALASGYKAENILVVNRNAAEVAWVSRRHSGVKCRAGNFGQVVIDDAIACGTFDVVNFDACSTVLASKEWMLSVRQAAAAVRNGGLLGITFLGGREGGYIANLLSDWTKSAKEWPELADILKTKSKGEQQRFEASCAEANRVMLCLGAVEIAGGSNSGGDEAIFDIERSLTDVFSFRYVSSVVPMRWIGGRINSHRKQTMLASEWRMKKIATLNRMAALGSDTTTLSFSLPPKE